MNSFNRRTAIRITAMSLLLAVLASLAGWFIARESAEETIVALAIEESRQLLAHYDAANLNRPQASQRAEQAVQHIAGGLFEIVELYSRDGRLVAEFHTERGLITEQHLSNHQAPNYQQASYQSHQLDNGNWVLRVFVPLFAHHNQQITGYFEGVRIIPEWQQQQIQHQAMITALLAALAALLCGASIYPVVVHLSAENKNKTQEVLNSHLAMMEALGRAIARRDAETGCHNYRVAWLACCIGEQLAIKGQAMQALIAGSFLHDIGKIGIPDQILLKPGKLDNEEFAIMKTHVDQGKEIVSGINWLEDAKTVVASHHEKWDGSGYPQQLAGESIPLNARIFAVADVFDALCSQRPYKPALPFEQSMQILHQDSGSHFDPKIIQLFSNIAPTLYPQIHNTSEADVKQLLAHKIRQHFEI